ncbi:MAG: hypothetical protein JRJ87_09135 [Deltaproteobacteria bacterium]|nr:hypothetical protein [Deltaproteobacteria bacterium]
MRVTYWILVGLISSVLFIGCSSDAGPGDSGIGDGEDAGDVDPCQAAVPQWLQTWQITIDESGLEGLTPDINVMDVWGTAPDDIYAVGFKGNILHYDGNSWTKMESGTEANLEGIWGYVLKDDAGLVTRTDIFAVGSQGTILRYDGVSWQPQRVINDPDPANPDPQIVTGNFHDIWGTEAPGPNPDQHPTVIAVGYGGSAGLIVRWESLELEFREMRQRVDFDYPCDAGTCTRISYQAWTPEKLGGVFGTAADFFIAVGNNGTILEYDGTAWARTVIAGFTTHLKGVWGRGAWEIFGVGLDGTILRRNNAGVWEDLKQLAQDQGGFISVTPIFLRSNWGFYQAKCGPTPDGGTEPEDTSWAFFIGWDNKLFVFHDMLICPMGELDVSRFEGIWDSHPRDETERTLEDGGIVCDPVEIIISGVNGSILRLINEEGQ